MTELRHVEDCVQHVDKLEALEINLSNMIQQALYCLDELLGKMATNPQLENTASHFIHTQQQCKVIKAQQQKQPV